ncbi:MAG: RidA family protein [Alphaproteobacteria bacterium]|nr:RidA family protein [Alphaproteobacteria bacterium]
MTQSPETPEERLKALEIKLPEPAAALAHYLPYSLAGNLLFISGQIAIWEGAMQFEGKVGESLGLVEARQAARVAVLNVIAQAKAACGGNLSRVKRCVRLGGYLNAAPTYTDHSTVMDHASDVLIQAFGKDIGQHARFVVGVNSLPKNSPIEIEAIFEIAPD